MPPPQLSVEAFRDALDELGVTQIWFAELVGSDVVTVNRWATGRVDVPSWVGLVLQLLRRERARSRLPLEAIDFFAPVLPPLATREAAGRGGGGEDTAGAAMGDPDKAGS